MVYCLNEFSIFVVIINTKEIAMSELGKTSETK